MARKRIEKNDLRPSRSTSSLRRINATDLLVLAILAAAGWGLWIWAAGQGDTEAWDHGEFWSVAVSVMAALSVLAGWLRPRTAQFAGLALVLPQTVALVVTSEESSPLAIVGLLFFIVFALVFTGIATIASSLRNGFNHR